MRTRDPDDSSVIPPTFSLSYEESANFMNEMWKAGIRPADHLSTTGELASMRAHVASLESEIMFLRNLVRHHLGMVT